MATGMCVYAWNGREHIFKPRASDPLVRTEFSKTNVSYLEPKMMCSWKNQVYIVVLVLVLVLVVVVIVVVVVAAVAVAVAVAVAAAAAAVVQ